MSDIRKEKSRFIITLDSGKQTYFDFADGKIYGISGKVNKKFNNNAMQTIRKESDKDFLAWYFTEISQSWSEYRANEWALEMVETIYTLFANKYSKSTLITIAEYCYATDYLLDKNGVKTISETLTRNNEKAINARYDWGNEFADEMNKTQFSDLPVVVVDLINAIRIHDDNKKMRKILIKDAEKIAFRMEHENWLGTVNHSMSTLIQYLFRYLKLCEIVKKEPTYKNLFLQLGYLDKEKELMQDQLNAEYQLNAPLFFENEKFITIIPTTATEFKDEADAQSNCVFRLYYPRVSERETHIVFIRKKSDIAKSYITCEVDNHGNIIQYLTRFNYAVKDVDALEFQQEYQSFLSNRFE